MNSNILDEQGKPVVKRNQFMTRAVKWLGANWRVWVPMGVSLVALIISGWSAFLSTRNNEVTHRLSKLDFRPSLRLYSLFKSIGKTPPHWELTNIGPVEAVQVKVQLISHRYFPTRQMIQVSLTGSDEVTSILKIAPQEWKWKAFPEGWLETNARLQNPPQCNIIEILLTYRRPQDLKEYSESAYYFVDPNGFWVPERSSSLKGELYESMKAALLKINREGPGSIYREWAGDSLHPNE
jgi:hypothetical protein